MATLANLVVKVTGDSSAMERTMDRTERRVRQFADRAAKGLAGVFAVDQIRRFGEASVREFAAAESVWSRLATTVEASGTSFDSVRGRIEGAASAMQRASAVGDEDFAEALRRITLQTGDVSKALGVMDIAADLAAAKQMDVSSAADLLGKALAGNTTQLTRQFPALKGSTDLLGDLRKMLKGAAEGEVHTLSGATKQLTNSWDNFKESIGRGLVGGDNSVETINNLASALQGVSDWFDSHSGVFDQLRASFADFASKTRTEAEALLSVWTKVKNFWNPRDALTEDMMRNDFGIGAAARGGGGGNTPPVTPRVNPNASVTHALAGGGTAGPSGKLLRKILAGNALPEGFARLANTTREGPGKYPGAPYGAMSALGGVKQSTTVSQAPGALSGVLGQVTSGFSGLLASFGPMSIVAEILTTAFEAMAPALQVLKIPIKAVGELLGKTLGKAISYLAEGIGWVIRAFGKAANWLLPGNPANGMVQLGQEMMDQARAVRGATHAVEKFAESFANVPNIESINRLRHALVSGGAVGSGGGAGGGGGSEPGKPTRQPIVINVNGAHRDPREIAEEVGRVIERQHRNGGRSRIAVGLAA